MIKIFGHYISKYYLALAVIEFFIIVAAFFIGYNVRLGDLFEEFNNHLNLIVLSAYLFSAISSVSLASLGLYQRGLAFNTGMFVRLLTSMILSLIAVSLLLFAFPDLKFGRGVIAYSLVFSFLGLLISRILFHSIISSSRLNHQVLVLGTGRCALMLHELENNHAGFFKINQFIRMDQKETEIKSDFIIDSADQSIYQLALKNEVDEIVIGMDEETNKKLDMSDLLDCKMAGIAVYDTPTFVEKETSRILVDQVNLNWFVFNQGFTRNIFSDKLKRLLDLIASTILLTVAIPFFLTVPIFIWLESRCKGSVFYYQERVGLDDHVFRIYKFRSMRLDAEKDGVARWASKNDDRITFIGKIIRKTRIDELPQLFNVFKGDMSMVGPRPERPEFIKDLEKEIPFYNLRHKVKPGLTGWAQLRYQYGTSVLDAKSKLEYDLYYVKNASIFLDLVIILETVEVVLMGKGAH